MASSLNADLLANDAQQAPESPTGVARPASSVRFLVQGSQSRSQLSDDHPYGGCSGSVHLCAALSGRCCLACTYCLVTCPLSAVFQAPQHTCCALRMAACQCCCRPADPVPTRSGEHPVIFFDGGGYAFPFGLGVAKHLLDNYDTSKCPVISISAGNLAALCLVVEQDPSEVLTELYDQFLDQFLMRPLCGFCDDLGVLRRILHQWLPDDVHERASGRLHVAMCPWPTLGFKFVSQFGTKQELVDAVVASCSFFGFVWRPVVSCHKSWPGCWVDGGYQNVLTPLDREVDLAVRPLNLPPWVPSKPASSLLPSAEAQNPPGVPIDLERAQELLRAAMVDAAWHLKESPGLATRLNPRGAAPVLETAVGPQTVNPIDRE